MTRQVYIYKTLFPLAPYGGTWEYQGKIDDMTERNAFCMEYDRFLKTLDNKPVNYDKAFTNGIEKLCNYFNSPEINLKSIGVKKDKEGKLVFRPVSISVLKKHRAKIIENTYRKVEGFYTEPVVSEFLDMYNRGNRGCWVNGAMLEYFISEMDGRIDFKNKLYDREYKSMARRVRKDFKKLLKLTEKKYYLYAIIKETE